MNIAVVGTRGIPARYGGFETFAEELSRRLIERGHNVRVYCRARSGRKYLGADLVYLPTLKHKYFDTLFHTALSTLHLVAHPVDVALYCNAANAIFTWMPRLAGVPVALNVDGLERKRRKWNALARAWYLASERLSTFCPAETVSDAIAIAKYYRERYGKQTHFIPYGAAVGKVDTRGALDQFGLEPGQYFLYVSRMEPENNALLVRESFERVDTNKKLVLVGDAPYAGEYIQRVRATRDPRIVIPGAIYGEGYRELQSHCFAYIHATEVGGTHPALIEAMGRRALVLFLETEENNEVSHGAGLPFTPADLADRMRDLLRMSESEREAYREAAAERVRQRYSWEAVTDAYERLFQTMLAARSR